MHVTPYIQRFHNTVTPLTLVKNIDVVGILNVYKPDAWMFVFNVPYRRTVYRAAVEPQTGGSSGTVRVPAICTVLKDTGAIK